MTSTDQSVEATGAVAGDWGVIGHEPAIRSLMDRERAGRLGHAFLITGPAGIGKRTLALALARYLNCRGEPRPCYRCGPCKRLSHDTFVDLQELVVERSDEGKVKQGISVEQIRELADQAVLPPMDGAFKCFLIREAELLTSSAANALLKTLEEPPAHTILVLLAPTRESVMPTVVSRCLHIRLAPLAASELEQTLVTRRGISAEDAASLAWSASGLPGLALALLDDEEVRQAHQRALELLRTAVEGDLVDRFAVAEEMATIWSADRERGRATLRRWSALIQAALREQAGAATEGPLGRGELNESLQRLKLSELAALLRSLERLPYRLDHMQPRTAFETWMLEFEAAGRRTEVRS